MILMAFAFKKKTHTFKKYCHFRILAIEKKKEKLQKLCNRRLKWRLCVYSEGKVGVIKSAMVTVSHLGILEHLTTKNNTKQEPKRK